MTSITRLTNVDFGFAAKAAMLALALTLTTLPQAASADTIIRHGVEFNRQWYEANVDSYDYTPLDGAEQHYDNVVGLERVVYAFTIKTSYCKPPHQPQKSKDRRMLDEFAKILRKRQSEQEALVPIAAMVRGSEHAAKYRVKANYVLVDSIRQYFGEIADMINAKREALDKAPEVDCSNNRAIKLKGSRDMILLKLYEARQTNPHNQRREVALPNQNGAGLDSLNRANSGSQNARPLPNNQNGGNGRQPNNGSSPSNQGNNGSLKRETGDATGVFSTPSRTETPISRETGDNTGVFNQSLGVAAPVTVNTPVMRETGDATGVFSPGSQRQPVQPTSQSLSFPTTRAGAFTTRVGSSVEIAGEREPMSEPNY